MGSLFCLVHLVAAAVSAASKPIAFTTYKTEPFFKPERVSITDITSDRSLLAPGYVFITPMLLTWGWGPEIYDMDGELVFYGNQTSEYRVQDFHVCDYLGQQGTHLCWHELERRGGKLWGRKRIFDQTYSQVGKNYTGTGQFDGFINGHEFQMADDGTKILMPVYEHKTVNLEPYHGPKHGAVHDGCFQEISVLSGTPTFQWCCLDHFEVWESTLYFPAPGQKNFTAKTAGDGGVHAWDFAHMNAIDKNEEGDYLVSGRHLDQVFKVAGLANVHGAVPGTILWRLGGHSNDFEMVGGFSFTKQHAVRYLSTGPQETVLSIFNNGWEGVNPPTVNASRGMVIKVDNSTKKAYLLHEYPHPYSKISKAQGNTLILPNKNAFIGWGTVPDVSEFSESGELLYHATFQNVDGFDEWNYRAFKSPWVGLPTWPPKLVAYKKTCHLSPLVAYVSWNGATEVRFWRFYTAESRAGPWKRLGMASKTKFETKAEFLMPVFQPYVSVQALDFEGKLLGFTIAATFVPQDEIRQFCNRDGCLPVNFLYPPTASKTCGKSFAVAYLGLIIVFALVESLDSFAAQFIHWAVRRRHHFHRNRRGVD